MEGKAMAYKKKAECEKEFVQELIAAGGVKSYGCMYEHGHYYWFFNLKDGTRRYWTNLSKDNQKLLGVSEQ